MSENFAGPVEPFGELPRKTGFILDALVDRGPIR